MDELYSLYSLTTIDSNSKIIKYGTVKLHY